MSKALILLKKIVGAHSRMWVGSIFKDGNFVDAIRESATDAVRDIVFETLPQLSEGETLVIDVRVVGADQRIEGTPSNVQSGNGESSSKLQSG